MELTLAERYKVARVEAEGYLQEALALEFQNGEQSKTDKENFIEERAKSKSREFSYSTANAERLLDNDVEDQLGWVNKTIAINEEKLQKEFDPKRREQIQTILETCYSYKAMGKDKIKELLVADAEVGRDWQEVQVKSELLISELGLTGKKNYLTYRVDGLNDSSVLGDVKREEIPQLAESVKQSGEFEKLLNYSKVESILDYVRFNAILGKTKLGEMAEEKTQELSSVVNLKNFVASLNEMDNASEGLEDCEASDVMGDDTTM